MGFDRFIHSKPRLYQAKLNFINFLKRIAYKLLIVDKKVQKKKKEVEEKNKEILDKYVKGKNILEIGCGRGDFLKYLKENFHCQCYGIDISKEMVEYARKNNPGPYYIYHNDVNLKYKSNVFDVVVFNSALHHIPSKQLKNVISEAKRVAKDKIIIFEGFLFESGLKKFLLNLYYRLVDGGSSYKSMEEWKKEFDLPLIEENEAEGLVRYGSLVFEK